jgi:hypothetical protein
MSRRWRISAGSGAMFNDLFHATCESIEVLPLPARLPLFVRRHILLLGVRLA